MQPTKGEISREEYAMRRQKILARLPSASIAILPGGEEKYRNGDAEYPFRQTSHFYYLTGFTEPGALLVLLKGSDVGAQYVLFCRSKRAEEEVWTGKKTDLSQAKSDWGADQAYYRDDLDRVMIELLQNKQQIFYTLGVDPIWDEQIIQWVKSVRTKVRLGIQAPETWVDFLAIISEERLIKSPSEIALMRRAASVSADAHIALMQACKPGMWEYELAVLFAYECGKRGCNDLAYTTIVGGGSNACILHYDRNNQLLQSGDLVLVDAGSEEQYYASDLTRTFPVNGKFTADQQSIYNIVLKAQLAAIDQIKPGARFTCLQETIVGIITEGLVGLDILKGDVKTLVKEGAYKPFYMHSSGHWLGLDVHDTGRYKHDLESRALEVGMVLTVEPGIYLSPNQLTIDKRWWGIGIRIEDDIVVTDNGYEILSKAAPKTIDEIEALMGSK